MKSDQPNPQNFDLLPRSSTSSHAAAPSRLPASPGGEVPDLDETEVLKMGLAGAFYNCGLERLRKGDLLACISDFTEALHLNPSFALALRHRGVAREAQGDLAGAHEDYGAALLADPTLAGAMTHRGPA